MDWLIQRLIQNDTIVAAGVTFLLSVLGAKKVLGSRINTVFAIAKETLEVVMALSKALKPDEDGKIRIDKKELQEINKELTDMKRRWGRWWRCGRGNWL